MKINVFITELWFSVLYDHYIFKLIIMSNIMAMISQSSSKAVAEKFWHWKQSFFKKAC